MVEVWETLKIWSTGSYNLWIMKHGFLPFFFVHHINFSCPITLTKSSRTILINKWENGYPCLSPDFKIKILILTQFTIMLAIYNHMYILICSGVFQFFCLAYQPWYLLLPFNHSYDIPLKFLMNYWPYKLQYF